MKEYIMALMVTVAVCSLSLILLPETTKGGGRYTKLVASLCILSVAISPVSSFISSLRNLEVNQSYAGESESREVFEEIYEDMLCGVTQKDISQRIGELVCSEFDIESVNLQAFAELSLIDEEYRILRVAISLSGEAIIKNPHEIKGYVSTLLGCECEIVYT